MTGNSFDRASSARSGLQNFNEEAFQECLRQTESKAIDIVNKQNPTKAKEGLEIIKIIHKKNPARAREIFNSYIQLNDQIEVSQLFSIG